MTLSDALERLISVIALLPPDMRDRVRSAMDEVGFEVVMTVGNKRKADEAGASIVMTLPINGEIPLYIQPVLMAIGYPTLPPSSITPLTGDRMLAYWEYGSAPVKGEMAWQAEDAPVA